MKTAQRRLGHSSANMTLDTYAHHLPGGEMAVARMLDEALGRLDGEMPRLLHRSPR